MQARARVRFLRTSPKKMRRVAALIKGKPVEEALNILNYTPKVAAHHLAKTVKAAAANAIANVGTAKLKAEDLSITSIMVDGGPIAPRVRFQSMGRAHRIRRRFCHLTVEVEGEPEPETVKGRGGRRKKAKEEAPETEEKKTAVKAKKTASKADKAAAEDKVEVDKIDETKAASEEAASGTEAPAAEVADTEDTKKDE